MKDRKRDTCWSGGKGGGLRGTALSVQIKKKTKKNKLDLNHVSNV